MSGPCFLIAEAGVNHNGSREMALALVDAAAAAGADAVKFQTFHADDIVVPGTEKAAYQKANTAEGDQHAMIRSLELSEADHEALVERCAQRGIEFMSTPFDLASVDLLLRLGMRRIKIASGELTNRPFLEVLARTGKPLILSTGMATLDETARAVEWLRASRGEAGWSAEPGEWLTVLHCTSNYPAEPADVNLRAMSTMQTALGVPVGYSDHTLGIEVSLAAVAMGACVLEKHFTLDRSMPGPDHPASLDPIQLAALVAGVRAVEQALGNGVKEPRASELPVRALVRRSAFVGRDLPQGTVLDAQDLRFLRPGHGIGPEHSRELVGRRTARALTSGTLLRWEDLA
jgi:N,N'-diacetyllegionaminate synthase